MKPKKQKKNTFRCLSCQCFYPNDLMIFVPPAFLGFDDREEELCGCCPKCSIEMLVNEVAFMQFINRPEPRMPSISRSKKTKRKKK
jgi:hypothetical protein